jgi:hypothetical protein
MNLYTSLSNFLILVFFFFHSSNFHISFIHITKFINFSLNIYHQTLFSSSEIEKQEMIQI